MFVYSPTKQNVIPDAPVSREDLRNHNSALVLRRLWSERDGASRSDIARATGLSKATVSAIVSDLENSGLVKESRQTAPSGGRPGIVLRFRYDYYAVIGVELGASHVTVVLMNLAGAVEESFSEQHNVREDPEGAIALTNRLVDDAMASCPHPVIGMGIGVPAPLHAETPGRLSSRVHPRWSDVDLNDVFSAGRPFPVQVENDANLGALAEHWWGVGRGFTDFTYVKVSTGIGAGLIMGGDIYRGPGGIAGELGHMIIEASSSPSQINDLVGNEHLLREVLGGSGELSPPEDWTEDNLTMEMLTSAAKAGHPGAAQVVQRAGRRLGIAVANLFNITNPARVVLGGPITAAGNVLMDPVRAAVSEHVLHLSQRPPEVLVTSLRDEAVALGGATAVLQRGLSDPRFLTSNAPMFSDAVGTRFGQPSF